jgi:hypothetical protein
VLLKEHFYWASQGASRLAAAQQKQQCGSSLASRSAAQMISQQCMTTGAARNNRKKVHQMNHILDHFYTL